MNLYMIRNKQDKTPTRPAGPYYCDFIIVRAETEETAKALHNETWFTPEEPVLLEDNVRGKINKVTQIVLKPIEGDHRDEDA